MLIQELRVQCDALRQNYLPLFAVSNREWYSLFKDEIRNSIAIEGIFANRNDLLNVLEHKGRTSTEKTAAILGYFEAASSLYEYANNLYKENEFRLRLADIKQIHTLLMRYEMQVGSFSAAIGDFRNEDVDVIESKFTPLKHDKIRDMMHLFVSWVNKNIGNGIDDPMRLAVAAHVLFETIHPFRDGNGRVGRILLNYLLIGQGFVNIAIKGIRKEDRERYYQALEVGDDEFEQMLRQFEAGADISIEKRCHRSDLALIYQLVLNRLQDVLKRLQNQRLVPAGPDAVLPLRQIAQHFNYSQDYLRNMINKGKIPAVKKGKLWYVKIRDIQAYIENLSS
ncbi:MAG: Fic family protein [bacterium]